MVLLLYDRQQHSLCQRYDSTGPVLPWEILSHRNTGTKHSPENGRISMHQGRNNTVTIKAHAQPSNCANEVKKKKKKEKKKKKSFQSWKLHNPYVFRTYFCLFKPVCTYLPSGHNFTYIFLLTSATKSKDLIALHAGFGRLQSSTEN